MMLWDSTHRDVHPAPTSYDEAWNRTVEYASAIRAAFPDLEVHGPISVSGEAIRIWVADMDWVEWLDPALELHDPALTILQWGWCAYWNSAVQSPSSCTDSPDRQAHGGTPFIQWLLQQLVAYHAATGVLLITHIDGEGVLK